MADDKTVRVLSVRILHPHMHNQSFRTASFRVEFQISGEGGRVRTTTREGGATRVCGLVPADQKHSVTARLDKVFSNFLYGDGDWMERVCWRAGDND